MSAVNLPTASSTQAVILAGRRALELTLSRFAVAVEEGPDRGRQALLSAASLCIGTREDNDLVLTDPMVSGGHAMLALTPDGVLVTDRGSKNGTWLDGTRVQSAYAADGALLRLGGTTCRLHLSPGRLVVFPDEETSFAGMMGRSQAMRDLFGLVRQLAKTDLPVLLYAETGCGKELVARALHSAGPRREKPFLVLDCGSIVPELLKSELFGHEKGAFTGADRTTKGVLEEAQGGTVFLDEIGEIDLGVQPHLLRALESREISRIGSRQATPVNFRIVAASNRDLRQMAEEGRFRTDLYFRLSYVTVRIPPLRERLEDLPLLATHFAAEYATRNGIAPSRLADEALARLAAYPWPGNVRELKGVVETACALSGDGPLVVATIERVLSTRGPIAAAAPGATPAQTTAPSPAPPAAPLASALEATEMQAISEALMATGWRRKAAARRLGISPTTLFAKIRRYGLKPPFAED